MSTPARVTSMAALLRLELRGLVRCWPLWPLPLLAALAGVAMLSSNARAYATYIDFDPQALDDQLAAYRFDLRAVYTSGLGWAQLLATVAGAFLVQRDRRLTGQPVRPSPPVDPGPRLVAKAWVAALVGMTIALVDLAFVLPRAAGYVVDHWTRLTLLEEGMFTPEPALTNGWVWPVVLCGVTGVALFAVIGAGLAALSGSGWATTLSVAVVGSCGSFVFWCTALSYPAPIALGLSVIAATFLFLLGSASPR